MLSVPKETLLKKQLIKNLIIVSAIVLVLAAGGTWLSSYTDETAETEESQKRQNDDLHNKYNDYNAKLTLATNNESYYNAYIKTHNPDFTLDREMITNLLTALSRKNHLSNKVGLEISRIIPVDSIGLKNGKALVTTVSITDFSALTDNSVFNFIHDLQIALPGIVVVSQLNLTRKDELSNNALDIVKNQHSIVALVSGNLTFQWIGTSQKQENVPATNAPAPVGNGTLPVINGMGNAK